MANKERLLRLPAVKDRTGKSSSSIYEGIQRGEFPAPVPMGRRTVAWVESEIDSWIADQVAKRGSVEVSK